MLFLMFLIQIENQLPINHVIVLIYTCQSIVNSI